jgi:hypothetical protein
VRANCEHLWKLDDDRRRQKLLGTAMAEESRRPLIFRGYVTVVNEGAVLGSSTLMLK